jgi:hypothetical protein
LAHWIRNTLEQLSHDAALKEREKVQRADDALLLCLGELVRQVGYTCVERGELLQQLLSCYFGIIKKLF